MKRFFVFLIFAVSACGAQQEEVVMVDEPVMEEAPLLCGPNEIAVEDGIGGTGCKLP